MISDGGGGSDAREAYNGELIRGPASEFEFVSVNNAHELAA